MVDKIVVTVHVTINGVPLEIWIAQTYLKLSPISLISVTYSQDATHVKYARSHNEEWISNGRMLHSISSECISMRLFAIQIYRGGAPSPQPLPLPRMVPPPVRACCCSSFDRTGG